MKLWKGLSQSAETSEGVRLIYLSITRCVLGIVGIKFFYSTDAADQNLIAERESIIVVASARNILSN